MALPVTQVTTNSKTGKLFVVTGPSGVGKGTLCAYLASHLAEVLRLSISTTSRPMRIGEHEGVDYFFTTRQEFEAMSQTDQLLEWAEYNGNYYGTPRAFVQGQIDNGKGVLLEIDAQGALQVKERFPMACLIFIEPPSMDALETRLMMRGTNTDEEIAQRLQIARNELALKHHFDYVVMNDNLEICKSRVIEIIKLWLKA